MSLHEAEARRTKRQSSGSNDERTDDEGRGSGDVPNGVFLVAAVAFLGGAVDLLVGLLLLPTPLLVFGVPLAALGGLKCWAAVGLFRLRARGAGLVILLYGVGVLVDGIRVVITAGYGGSVAEPVVRILFALGIIGYLLIRTDRFD